MSDHDVFLNNRLRLVGFNVGLGVRVGACVDMAGSLVRQTLRGRDLFRNSSANMFATSCGDLKVHENPTHRRLHGC